MMRTTLAQRLATNAVWPVAVQHRLATSQATRPAVLANQHLDPAVVAAVAATCTRADLPQLTQNQRRGVEGLRACLRRSVHLYEGASRWDNLDFEVAWALLCGNHPQRVRDLAADIRLAPTRSSTAAIMYAAGLHRLDIVERFERDERARWVTSPYAACVSDDVAWDLIQPRETDSIGGSGESLEHALRAALIDRPALLEKSREHGVGDEKLSQARLNLIGTNCRESLEELDPAEWADALAFRCARSGIGNAPLLLAQAAPLKDWTPEDGAKVDRFIRDGAFTQQLGWVAPKVAARFGTTAGVPVKLRQMLTWEGQRKLSPDIDYVDIPDPGELRVKDLTAEFMMHAGTWMTTRLADPDESVVAARWAVALTAADKFPGTLGELVEIAHTITTPAYA